MFFDKKNVYFIAEIGINHNGDINIAKKLIDAAFSIGWDCVKFQKRNPEKSVPEEQKNIKKDTPWGSMTYLEYKKKIEFGLNEYNIINEYCNQENSKIDWTISLWDEDSSEFTKNFDLPFVKIPSAHLTNMPLLQSAVSLKKPILLSTGMSTLEEVDEIVNFLERQKVDYALMHCNSSYPTPPEELNLSLIPFLKKRYNCIVGYSGHEYNLEPTIVAITFGAEIVERHITLDHNMWGTDHSSSLEIDGMEKLYNRAKDIKKMIGFPNKKVTNSEISVRKKLRGY